MNKAYWLKSNWLFVRIEDKQDGITKSILLDVQNFAHYTPNETAAFLLSFLPGKISHDDLKAKLKKQYNIADQGADQAISKLKARLSSFGGIEEGDYVVPDQDPDWTAPQVRPYPGDPDIQAGGSVITIGNYARYKTG